MARWRAAAIERLPDLRDIITSADNPMALWIELSLRFADAYREPRNEQRIAGIYAYADWCMNAPPGTSAETDPVTGIIVAFYEHLPTSPSVWEDMPRWFQRDEVAQNAAIFSRHINPTRFEALLAHLHRHRNHYVPRTPPS